MVLIALGSIGAVMLALVGISQFASLAGERRRIVAAAAGFADEEEPFLDRLNRTFRSTRLGGWVERELVLAGIRQRPIVVFLVAAAFGVTVAYVLWTALAPVFGLIGLASGGFALRAYIRRAKDRRLEAFIVQMPELARVLANATNAGLSISTAIGIAGDELADPARSELQKVSNAIKFGADLESALDDMERRLPSREVAVLISTLVVSARSGGSLVTSLRDIADTLEARKETRREIKTTLAQSVATGYLVIVMGFGMLFMLNVIQPGSVEAMTSHVVGQLALVISGSLFTLGFYLIRRMTRFEL
ncbi:type II secretion system F family protein [Nocardioides sp. MH1]|uniref:type II secretion system F family protein n=1 Tax=Nocardioides sp. MH1 TaxID=3242490 RepID=UPI003520E8AE